MRHTIAIIGVGAVGSAIANAIISLNISADLILLDKDEKRCAGHVQDLSDALGFSLTSRVFQGSYEDVKKAHIVIISAGRPQLAGESRLELLGTNKEILDDVLSQLVGLRQDALVIVVTNPLDVLTYCALRQLDIPRKQIFGTGTYLDSQRLSHLLGNELGISERSIEAFVLGEHGDSQVIAWSATKIAGNQVEQFGITPRSQRELAVRTTQIAYEIIHAKGASYFGISSSVAQLCEMILYNARQIVPISWYHEEYGVCMSLPVLLTEKGIEKTTPFALTKKEQEALERSAEILRKYQKLV